MVKTSAKVGKKDRKPGTFSMQYSPALEAAELLRKQVENDPDIAVPITISIGVATFTPEDDSDSLILKADKAMYQAKQTGRNKVIHYNDIPQDH